MSNEDTEEDALARATETEGTSCSSLYELRTTGFTFTVREVSYTLRASNLQPGISYEGCVRIRKREAYRGTPPEEANLEWEEVEPDVIPPFEAAPDEDGFTELEGGDLPNEQGYEYEILSVDIWPVGSGCECVTEYVPEPDPE